MPPRPLAHPRIRTRCAALALRARAPAPVTSLHACVCGRCARRAHAAPRDPRLARLVHRHENGRSRAPVQRLPSYVYGTDAAGARAPVWCRGRSTGSVEPDACLRCAAGRSRRATWATTPTLRRGAPPPRACGCLSPDQLHVTYWHVWASEWLIDFSFGCSAREGVQCLRPISALARKS